MVLKSKKGLKPDIWSETKDETKSTKDMIKKIWANEAHCWQEVSGIKTITMFSFGKELKHTSALTSYYINIKLLL